MRALLAAMIATLLVGCSDSPEEPDLTAEQRDALQVLGEMLPESDHSRWIAAASTVRERGQVYVDVMNSFEYGTDERREASAKELSFSRAENNLSEEYFRRRKIDGKKAADWYVAEIQKSDTQLIGDWSSPRIR